MKQLFTIGSSKKTAEKFFTLLEDNNIRCILDVRLKRKSQLIGFCKYPDIKFLLKRVSNIDYIYDDIFAPSEKLFEAYKKKQISWEEYAKIFLEENSKLKVYIETYYPDLDKCCLLCSEDKPDKCHRRLLAEMICEHFGEYELKHLY